MLELIKAIILGAFLLTEGIRDLRKRKIAMFSVAIYGVIGVGLQLFILKESGISIVGGVFIGILFLALAKLTGEQVGYGDGWVLMVTGVYLGFRENMFLLALSLLLTAAASMLLLMFKKAGRKTSLPFAGFMVPGYVLLLMIKS